MRVNEAGIYQNDQSLFYKVLNSHHIATKKIK
jgi:hypothetical protein